MASKQTAEEETTVRKKGGILNHINQGKKWFKELPENKSKYFQTHHYSHLLCREWFKKASKETVEKTDTTEDDEGNLPVRVLQQGLSERGKDEGPNARPTDGHTSHKRPLLIKVLSDTVKPWEVDDAKTKTYQDPGTEVEEDDRGSHRTQGKASSCQD